MAPKVGSVSRQAENRGCRALSIERATARQTAKRSGSALQLALLGNALVRLIRALDAILLLVAFGRQDTHDLVDAGRIAAAEQARDDVDIVTDAKLMSQDNLLIYANLFGAAAAAQEPSCDGSMSL